MSRDIAPFGVRMPTELKALVDEAAIANGRSINAEVVARLQESFSPLTHSAGIGMNIDILAEAIAERVAARLKRDPR